MGILGQLALTAITNSASNNQMDDYNRLLAAIRNNPDITPDQIPIIEGGMFRDPEIRAKLQSSLNSIAMQQIGTRQDAPLLNAVKSVDPVTYDYGTEESLIAQGYSPADIEDQTPLEQQGQAVMASNFKTPEGLQSFYGLQDQNRTVQQLVDSNVAMGMPVEQAIPLAKAQVIDPQHLAARTGQIEQTYKHEQTAAANSQNQQFGAALNEWMANNPDATMYQKTNAVTTFASRFRPDKEIYKTTLEAIKQSAPEYKVHDAGTGVAGQTQPVAYDPFNPTAPAINVGQVKQAFEPKGTTVNNYLPQQETAYSKKTGELLAEREGEIAKNGDLADKELQNIAELRGVLSKAYTGPAAAVMPALNRFAGVGNAEKAANTTSANVITGNLVLAKIKQLGANPSEGDRKFLEKMQAKTTYSPMEQQQMLDIMEKTARGVSAKRDQLVAGTYTDEARKDPARSERNIRSTPAQNKLPDAAANKGRKIRDNVTGRVLQSNGMAWVTLGGR